MPEIHVFMAANRTTEQKKRLMAEITDAVVRSIGSPKDAVTVQIIESPLNMKSKGGVPFDEREVYQRKA